jgi:dihydrofolate reductase
VTTAAGYGGGIATVVADFSMSVDGFVAGPDVSVAQPMGAGGERLHEWLFADPPSPEDAAIARDARDGTGAVVLGRRTFEVGLGAWGDTPFPAPCFVVTHEAREERVERSGTFAFVTAGLDVAVERARAAAGERLVRVMGADVARQALAAGLVDEVRLQLVPVLLGSGVPLFGDAGPRVELERTRVVASPRVTHVRLRVR